MNLNNNKKISQNCVFALALVLFLLPTKIVFAETTATSSSDSTAVQKEADQEKENSTINNIKKVIQEKKTELGSVGANLRSEKAYLAKVLRVSEETLTVSNSSGNKIVPLDENVLISKNDKDIKVNEIAVGNWVGVFSEALNDSFKIKKVTVYEQDFSPKDKIITLGSISMIGKNDLKVTPRSGEKELAFSFSKKTSFQDYQGEDAKLTDFYEDLQCIVVAFADKNGNYVVSTIRALSTFEK
jgi:hypothetical protein